MQIRNEFAHTIALKLTSAGSPTTARGVEQVKGLVENVASEVRTKADDAVEINFERVAQTVTGTSSKVSRADAELLKEEAPEAIKAFGDTFLFGYGSFQNTGFEAYGDGMFSFRGGNNATRDITFMVDTSPGIDGIQWMILDNTKLPSVSSMDEKLAARQKEAEESIQSMVDPDDGMTVVEFFEDFVSVGDHELPVKGKD